MKASVCRVRLQSDTFKFHARGIWSGRKGRDSGPTAPRPERHLGDATLKR